MKGEWADGTASDDLTLFSRSTDGPIVRPNGRYHVLGRNPNGSRYHGTADVTDQGDRFIFEWQVGRKLFRGVGKLDGSVMIVNWGEPTPVVYALAADGSLQGLWGNGRGEDVLIPAR